MKHIIITAALLLIILPARASAHVLVKDTNGSSGMIVHVQPDDDPIAGVPAVFYFDLADANITTDNFNFELSVTDAKGEKESVKAQTTGPTSVSASYTFPYQGLYKLELRAASDNQTKIFEFSQLVSRGSVVSPLDEPRYAWAEFLLILSGSGLVILVVIVIIRRKQIAAFTKKV